MNMAHLINRWMLKEVEPVNGYRTYHIKWWAIPIIHLRIKLRGIKNARTKRTTN